MKLHNINHFNDLNKQFYQKTASAFDQTRQMAWPGWERVWEVVSPNLPLNPKVLDVGCGNGRFGIWLQAKNVTCEYTGIDNNKYLIDQAQKSLSSAHLILTDLNSPIKLPPFDLITLFGVMHHIPGNRGHLLQQLSHHLQQGGMLVVSFWQFLNDPKIEEKILERLAEPGDYLLDWQKTGIPRYCHQLDGQEIDEIKQQLGLEVIVEFEADGKTGNMNRYLVFRHAND